MKPKDVLRLFAFILSISLTTYFVHKYNQAVALLPREMTTYEALIYGPIWNQHIAWLKQRLILAMSIFLATDIGIDGYNAWKTWKKSGLPLHKWIVRRYAEFYEKILRGVEKWVNTNTSESA